MHLTVEMFHVSITGLTLLPGFLSRRTGNGLRQCSLRNVEEIAKKIFYFREKRTRKESKLTQSSLRLRST